MGASPQIPVARCVREESSISIYFNDLFQENIGLTMVVNIEQKWLIK